jgi:hypothetical protein
MVSAIFSSLITPALKRRGCPGEISECPISELLGEVNDASIGVLKDGRIDQSYLKTDLSRKMSGITLGSSVEFYTPLGSKPLQNRHEMKTAA